MPRTIAPRHAAPLIAALALWATACDPSEPTPGDGGQFGEETDTGCQVVVEVPLELDEVSDLGISARDLLDLAEGDHASTMAWADGASAALSLSVSAPTNARLLDYEYVSDGSGAEPDIYCADVLVVDVSLAVSTDDGRLDEARSATLQGYEGDGPSLTLELDDLVGTLDPASFSDERFDSVWADLDARWDEAGVTGEISGYGEASSGSGPDGTVSLTRFEIGAF